MRALRWPLAVSVLCAAASCGGGGGGSGASGGSGGGIGTIQVSWTAPTLNTDGTSPADVSGYRVRYGVDAAQLTQSIDVSGAGANSAQINGLAPATYYVAIESLNAAGTAGSRSNPASITLP
jgi:hypothetical protein